MRRLAYRRGGHWRNGVAKSPATTRNRSVQRPFCIGVPTDIDVAHSSDIRRPSCRNTPQQTPASRRGAGEGLPIAPVSTPTFRYLPSAMTPTSGEGKAYPVSYTHLRAHETDSYLVCRLLLEKKKKQKKNYINTTP